MIFYFRLVLLLTALVGIESKADFTNAECYIDNEELGIFRECALHSINRTYKYLTVKMDLFEPIKQVTLNVATFKRASGWKPFLYNISVNFCSFMKNKNKNRLTVFMVEGFLTYTNLNHTCPFYDTVMIDGFDVTRPYAKLSKRLTIASGEYAFFTDWILNKKYKATVRLYGKIDED